MIVIAVPLLISTGMVLTSYVSSDRHREIVDINTYPWSSIGKISAIGYSSGQLCTGVVIGSNQLLTAAHCLYNKPTARFMQAKSIHVLLGYVRGDYRAHRVAFRYLVPEDFYPFNTKSAGNDFAIIYTKEPFPPDIEPLRLAAVTPPLGTAVKIAGYTIERPHMITADEHCRITAISSDKKLIAHTCVTHHGDSGGPLLGSDGNNEGLIWGINIGGYPLLVELREQSKEGGVAVSAATITDFLASRVVGSIGSTRPN